MTALMGLWSGHRIGIGRGGLRDEVEPGEWPSNRDRPGWPSGRGWAWGVAFESVYGLGSSSGPERPYSGIPGTPGEVSR